MIKKYIPEEKKVIALYARISKKDKRGGTLSNTIENQMILLRSYVSDNGLCNDSENIYEFIDDGFSGTDRKRPSFMKMLAWIELGKADMVIVKDFSRLSREHLLISELREKYFPLKQVRFIAILDNYDSDTSENMRIIHPFKTLFNEYYCSDISRKVRTSLEAKKTAGEYAVAKLPYGYELSDGKITVDEKKAEIIRAIYKMRYEGSTYGNIAKIYDMTVSMVWRILHEPSYLGYHVWHRYENEFLPLKKRIKQYPDGWRVVADTNNDIAIIDKTMLSEDIIKYYESSHRRNGARHIFHGLTKCMLCKKALVMDRAKKGWLCCMNCTGKEKKLIETERLYQLFFDRLTRIFAMQRSDEKTKEHSEDSSEYIKKICDNIKTDVEKEMFMNIFVKKIFVGEKENVIIFWRFKRQ